MAGGRGSALYQGAASHGGELQSLDSSPEEQAPRASITAGEIPLDILLRDPELSTQDGSTSLRQIAELIPDDDSSLALVATLWTVPTDSRAEPAAEGEPSSGEQAEPASSSDSPPPWAVFVIGLDEAIERSRNACETTLFARGRPGEGDLEADSAVERLEWRCPIIPAAEGRWQPGRPEQSSPGIGPAAIDQAEPSAVADSNRPPRSRCYEDEALLARSCPEDGSQTDVVGGQALTEGAVRSVWTASAFALFAGWLWTRRKRWKLGGSVARITVAVGGTDPKKEPADRSCARLGGLMGRSIGPITPRCCLRAERSLP
jgi:hypothetical protein